MISINALVWNDRNIAHIARHRVIPDEVEEICQGDFMMFRTYQSRYLLVGPTASNRMLGVVLEPIDEEQGVYFPVTARPASRKERRRYSEEKAGGEP